MSRLRYGQFLTIFSGILLIAFHHGNAQDNRRPTVGAPGFIEQINLPGTELAAKPLTDDRTPIVVRIVKTFPHGDSFRYDIAFQGLEPGKYNLADYLIRKDGSSVDDLPEIEIEILSLLPPGQIEPNELESGLLPRLGGYKNLMIVMVIFWVLVLIGLVFLGRKRKQKPVPVATETTLADLLKPRLELALKNKLDRQQFAELERMLFAFWRRQLKLESVSAEQAIAKIKTDAKAGPLMKQLERWIHSPQHDQQVSLAELLKPYESMSSELLDPTETNVMTE